MQILTECGIIPFAMKNRIMRHIAFATTMSAAAVGAGCAEQDANTFHGETSIDTVLTRTQPTQVRPDEAKFLKVLVQGENPELYETLKDDLQLVDHQYRHGRTDTGAPELSERPARIDAHVALSGSRSNYIDNDAGCDTLRVYTEGLDPNNAYIGAIALSENSADKAFVAWPRNENGTLSDEAYLCFFQDEEPADGVVMFVDDQPR